MSVDATAGGALMGKSIEVAKALLEEIASNNYHWSGERAAPKRVEWMQWICWLARWML